MLGGASAASGAPSEWIERWIGGSGYGAALGVKLAEAGAGRVRLALPYRDENSNPGRALHGGCAASLGLIGAGAVARATLGREAGPFHTASLHVSYLAAAVGEDVLAEARLLRQGKEMCFVAIEVGTADGKSIAHCTAMVRGRFGAAATPLARSSGDDGASDPGAMGPHVGKMPFAAGRGLRVEHMTNAHSRIAMPLRAANLDGDGGVHEGALLALFDTTGAMAAWAETGPGRFKASTPALQAQILAPPRATDLIAFGRLIRRDQELFWCDVEVAEGTGSAPGDVVARGTVLYRIVT
jgi:uncharacterized protein (TIGR00369 family)